MTDMIPVLEHPWCQVFYRSHKHLKDQELVNLKNVHNILLIGHHYLEIRNLSIRNFANKFSTGSFGSCLFGIKFFIEIFLQI